jgi:hypothetical protein
MLACVCTPPDTRLFSTPSGGKIKLPSSRRITVAPPFTAVPLCTTHLPSRRPPPAVTPPQLTEVELATPDPRESGHNSADGQVRVQNVRFRILVAASMKMTVFWVDGISKHLGNVSKLLPHTTAQHPRRQSSSRVQ